jgi:hypothetical protein
VLYFTHHLGVDPMLANTMLAIVHYDMHEPYEYGRLWEILRAEGLERRLLSSTGVWTRTPDSMWAMEIPPGDPRAWMEQLTERITTTVKREGLNADICVLVASGWAWSVTEGTPTASAALLAALGGVAAGPRF